ncbi:hypothetical protein BWZ22_00430 [Seonamhaeicola sp. S2-3]|uniref:DUF6146 family protein n=1 Tax=Seonamhaeicola sp. S2-3 TaxID=1936081 RepID=UPI000972E968|nr:DUF6146 family protein [Seonamhaeicola sp. S2-3]APY09802.1 hypothetical protein BWZ22_00430 [Seonamhaeicola sp. S2-3]
MRNLIYITITCLFLAFGCNTSKQPVSKNNEQKENTAVSDTVKIANEALEYEIIIIDPGYASWLVSRAKPEGFYSQQFLETRNNIYVIEWNQRVLQPNKFNPNLYELRIDYDPNIDYGYEVNYKLYNYFIYFQMKYNQRLGPFVPRI